MAERDIFREHRAIEREVARERAREDAVLMRREEEIDRHAAYLEEQRERQGQQQYDSTEDAIWGNTERLAQMLADKIGEHLARQDLEKWQEQVRERREIEDRQREEQRREDYAEYGIDVRRNAEVTSDSPHHDKARQFEAERDGVTMQGRNEEEAVRNLMIRLHEQRQQQADYEMARQDYQRPPDAQQYRAVDDHSHGHRSRDDEYERSR